MHADLFHARHILATLLDQWGAGQVGVEASALTSTRQVLLRLKAFLHDTAAIESLDEWFDQLHACLEQEGADHGNWADREYARQVVRNNPRTRQVLEALSIAGFDDALHQALRRALQAGRQFEQAQAAVNPAQALRFDVEALLNDQRVGLSPKARARYRRALQHRPQASFRSLSRAMRVASAHLSRDGLREDAWAMEVVLRNFGDPRSMWFGWAVNPQATHPSRRYRLS